MPGIAQLEENVPFHNKAKPESCNYFEGSKGHFLFAASVLCEAPVPGSQKLTHDLFRLPRFQSQFRLSQIRSSRRIPFSKE